MSAMEDRLAIRGWIEGIEKRFGIGKPEIAARSKVSRGTIYRFFDDAHPFSASLTTINKIAKAFDVALPGAADGGAQPSAPYGDIRAMEIEQFPPAALGEHEIPWIVQTRALELAGYLPGDIIVCNSEIEPRAGDVICAHIFNIPRGVAEYKLRILEQPFLTTRTMDADPSMRPMFVDPERVTILYTVTRLLRLRQQ